MTYEKLLTYFQRGGLERCGVVLSTGEVVELENEHSEPQNNFSMDLALFSENVIATWHTHPHDSPNLSVTDYNTFRSFPKLKHLIVSSKEIWGYYMENDILLRNDDNNLTWLFKRTSPT